MSKKGVELSITRMVVMILALLTLGGGIYILSTGQSLASFFSETGEHTTTDCDGDGAYFPQDECYCDPDIQKLDQGQSCGSNSEKSKETCPLSCKK